MAFFYFLVVNDTAPAAFWGVVVGVFCLIARDIFLNQ